MNTSVCVCVRLCACVAWGYICACLHMHVNTPVFPHIHAFLHDGVCVYMHNTYTHTPTNTHPHNTPVIKITRIEEGCGSEFSQCINLHLYKFSHKYKNRANTKPQILNIIIHQDTGKLLRVHTPRTRWHPQHTHASARFLSLTRHLLLRTHIPIKITHLPIVNEDFHELTKPTLCGQIQQRGGHLALFLLFDVSTYYISLQNTGVQFVSPIIWLNF